MTYLIKLGGSLFPQGILPLYRALKKLPLRKAQRIFLFPGGGEFADLIRKYRQSASLSDDACHAMALASLDQNAYLIADICKCPCITCLDDIKNAGEYPAVIAPYRIITERRPFTGLSLDIDILSSTSSALYCAHMLKAQCIVATDVDGVFEADPKRSGNNPKLLKKMSSQRLAGMQRGGPLDVTIPLLMDRYKAEVWVINGNYPDRVSQAIVKHRLDVGTVITFCTID